MLNVILLFVAIGMGLLLLFSIVSGPSTLGLFVADRLLHMHFHVQKEVIWVLLVLASAAYYVAYGLLLNFRFSMRKPVLVFVLLFHLGAASFCHSQGFGRDARCWRFTASLSRFAMTASLPILPGWTRQPLEKVWLNPWRHARR